MKKLLIAVIVFFILGLLIVAIIQGVRALSSASAPREEMQASGPSSGTSGGGSVFNSFVSSIKDTFWSPVPVLTGSGTPSGALPFFIPEVKAPGLSDSFSSEDEWREFASSSHSGEDEYGTPSDGIFYMSEYFGPTTTSEAKHFGEPSPQRGKVRIMVDETSLGLYGDETQYMTLQAATGIREAIPISGWTLQNMRTGQRLPIPHAVRVPRTGQTGKLQEIALTSAEKVIVSSQSSPLGISFKENICSGYLDQFQTFTPAFDDYCPLPSEELAATGVSGAMGESCSSFVAFMSQCEFYKGEVPDEVSAECVAFVRDHLSYNGCVATHQNKPGFLRPQWRVFLGVAHPWSSGDTIRLLDRDGRTVDAVTL